MMRAATYTLRIESDTPIPLLRDEAERFQRALSHAEDVIDDALPEGFYCKIDESNHWLERALELEKDRNHWKGLANSLMRQKQDDSGEGVDLAAVRELEKMADDQGR